jgi:polyphenol oxidase
MLDLRVVIAAKLAAAGVTEVQHSARCTSCDPELYFSHRRDGGVTGRQAGIIVRDGP